MQTLNFQLSGSGLWFMSDWSSGHGLRFLGTLRAIRSVSDWNVSSRKITKIHHSRLCEAWILCSRSFSPSHKCILSSWTLGYFISQVFPLIQVVAIFFFIWIIKPPPIKKWLSLVTPKDLYFFWPAKYFSPCHHPHSIIMLLNLKRNFSHKSLVLSFNPKLKPNSLVCIC